MEALPCDILLEIFCQLDASTLFRCAVACKRWRCAIVAGAQCLRPRPDRFCPDLLVDITLVDHAAGVDLSYYAKTLSSRDGLVLLGGRRDLCLYNPMNGDRAFLDATAVKFEARVYVLLTGHDLPQPSTAQEFAILAASDEGGLLTRQVFSSKAGEWGPAMSSPELRVNMFPYHEAVCRGVVHWLAYGSYEMRHTVSMDVRTGRTWTTDLPEECWTPDWLSSGVLALATSGNGRRLSVAMSTGRGTIRIWELDGGGGASGVGVWTERRMIDLGKHVPGNVFVALWRFCSRSGWLLAAAGGQVLRVHVDGAGPIQCLADERGPFKFSSAPIPILTTSSEYPKQPSAPTTICPQI